MQLSSIDLNLLVVLDALLQEEHVGRASQRVALSASATSHALARLRELFGDPLLVRAGRGLVCTPRAQELAPRVRQVLEGTELLLRKPAAFQPLLLERTFHVLASDHLEVVLLRRLEAPLRAQAPRVILHSRPIAADHVEQLREGRADVAFGAFTELPELPEDCAIQELFTDRFATVVRAGHPVLKRPWTLERYTELEHVLVAPLGTGTSPLDTLLAKRGAKRRVVRRVSSFLSALFLVSQSDHAVTLSARLARTLAPQLGLHVLESPIPFEYRLSQLWHRRQDADPAHAWFRALTARAAAELPRLAG